MRAVPHLKVVLSLRIDSSTSTVTLLSLGCLGLSLKVSSQRCLPLLSHLYSLPSSAEELCDVGDC